jgi:hypothetical protein
VSQDVAFGIKGVGLALKPVGAVGESGDLLPHQHLAPLPTSRLGNRRRSRGLTFHSEPIGFIGRQELLGSRARKSSNDLFGRIFRWNSGRGRLGRLDLRCTIRNV